MALPPGFILEQPSVPDGFTLEPMSAAELKTQTIPERGTRSVTRSAEEISDPSNYQKTAQEQSFGQNLGAGVGSFWPGITLRLRQMLGRNPSDEEIIEYQKSIQGLEGTWGGAIGGMAPTVGLSAVGLGAASKIPVVGALLSSGGIQGVSTGAGIGGAMGAIEGAAKPTRSDESTLGNMAVSGGVGVLGPLGASGIAKSGSIVKNMFEPFLSKQSAQNAAGRMINKAVGSQSDDIVAALRRSNAAYTNPTAAQAATGAGFDSTELAALERLAGRINPSASYARESAQRAGRTGILESIGKGKPALEAAEELRDTTIAANMEKAKAYSIKQRAIREAEQYSIAQNAPKQAAPAIEALKGNKVIQAAMTDARAIASNRAGLPEEFARLSDKEIADIVADPTKSLEGLKLMKFAIDSRFKNSTAVNTALSGFEDATVTNVKKAFMAAVNKSEDLYRKARDKYAKDSGEIFQMRVGQRAKDILDSPLGDKERGGMLSKVVSDEKGLIKKSGGFDRASLEDQLTPENADKLSRVIKQLDVNAKVTELATKGSESVKLMNAVGGGVNLPNLMNSSATIVNGALSRTLNANKMRTLGEMTEVLNNPELTAKLMSEATQKEKNAIKFMMRSMGVGAVATPAAVEAVR